MKRQSNFDNNEVNKFKKLKGDAHFKECYNTKIKIYKLEETVTNLKDEKESSLKDINNAIDSIKTNNTIMIEHNKILDKNDHAEITLLREKLIKFLNDKSLDDSHMISGLNFSKDIIKSNVDLNEEINCNISSKKEQIIKQNIENHMPTQQIYSNNSPSNIFQIDNKSTVKLSPPKINMIKDDIKINKNINLSDKLNEKDSDNILEKKMSLEMLQKIDNVMGKYCDDVNQENILHGMYLAHVIYLIICN